MSYTKITDYAAKDALTTGNPSKKILGTELGAEFDAIAVADALNLKTATTSVKTWTPAFTSSGATFAYGAQVGYYAVTGDVVDCYGYIALDSVGNTMSAQGLFITNLPITAKTLTGASFMVSGAVEISGFTSDPGIVNMVVSSNTSQITFVRRSGGSDTTMFSNYLQNSAALSFHVRYLK